jgi:N-acetylglucosamine-6-phosphate deacetylase
VTPRTATRWPGVVDLQVNGYGGVDFSTPGLKRDALIRVSEALASEGTSAFLATVVTSDPACYDHNLAVLADAVEHPLPGATCLGIHLEGPFISQKEGFVGAHDPARVSMPDPSILEKLWQRSRGTIRIVTLAAELHGATKVVTLARKLDITVSVGHSDCTDSDLETIATAGATAITHLGNALPNHLPRHHNPIWAGLANDDLAAMIVGDGFHLPDSVLKVILRVKGLDKTVLVSDVAPIAGLPAGEYEFAGSQVVLEETGRILNPERRCLAGSGLTLLAGLNHLASLQLIPPDQLIRLAVHNSLRLIHMTPDSLGSVTSLEFVPDLNRFVVV